MPTALVTGATSGIGKEFSQQLAAEGYNLVLVARDKSRLDSFSTALQEEFGITVDGISADLSTADGVKLVTKRLEDSSSPVEMLVNNAGFGLDGSFVDIPIEKQNEMVAVNVTAVLDLTHAAAKVMTQRTHGDIINISSVAAWTPNLRPSSTYAATKAFVTALSEGLAPTLAKSGVMISAVCPGFVKTEFHERAGIKLSKMPKFFWLDADDVVRAALADHRAGKIISIPTVRYKAIVVLARLTPRFLSSRVARFVGKKAGGRVSTL